LNEERIVPKQYLPSYEIDLEELLDLLNRGVALEFLEVYSPFHEGVGISTILHDGCYGNNTYVLVGESGIGYCEGNHDWEPVEIQPFGAVPVIGVAFGQDDKNEDIFVAIDTTNRYSVSRDGKVWEYVYTLEGNYDFEAITYFNRTFVILCSDGKVLRSVFNNGNLASWVEQDDTPNTTEACNDIVGGNNIYVVVGNNGRICVSPDASHFVPITTPTNENITSENLLCVAFGKGNFLVGGEHNTLIQGTNNTDYKIIPSPFTGTESITGTGYNAKTGLYIITNAIGAIATSADKLR
jgi:hypothetical protein